MARTDPEAERLLLSCLMRGGTQVREGIRAAVTAEMFVRYRPVAEKALKIARDGRPDVRTLRSACENEQAIEEVTSERPAPSSWREHASNVREVFGERKGMALGDEILEMLDPSDSDEDPCGWDEAFACAQEKMSSVQQALDKGETKHIRPAVKTAIKQLEQSNTNEPTGIPSAIPKLTDVLDGYRESTQVIIAARPSQGKTALALTEALNAAIREDVGVGIFSLEMGREELAQRMIAQEARVNVRNKPLGEDEFERITRAAGRISDAPIYIDDTPRMGPIQLRNRVRQLRDEEGIGLVVVDYLQLMQAPRGRSLDTRNKVVGAVARENKITAKELGLPVIALAQLNRGVESRNPPRPQLSDLRDSGEIEEHADIAAFLYRPEEYGITTDAQGNSTDGVGEIIVDKQRNGPTGIVEAAFVEQYASWQPLDKRQATPRGDGAPQPTDEQPF